MGLDMLQAVNHYSIVLKKIKFNVYDYFSYSVLVEINNKLLS